MIEKDWNQLTDDLFSVIPRFSKRVRFAGKQILEEKKLSKAHMMLLYVLQKHGVLNMSELGKILSVTKPNVTILVDKLVEAGFVERVPDKIDRRSIAIALTEAGKTFADDFKLKFQESLKTAFSDYSEEDFQLLNKTIESIKYLIGKLHSEE